MEPAEKPELWTSTDVITGKFHDRGIFVTSSGMGQNASSNESTFLGMHEFANAVYSPELPEISSNWARAP